MYVQWGPMELVATLIGHTARGATCEIEKYQAFGLTRRRQSIPGERAYRLNNGTLLERLESDECHSHRRKFRNCVTGEIIYIRLDNP